MGRYGGTPLAPIYGRARRRRQPRREPVGAGGLLACRARRRSPPCVARGAAGGPAAGGPAGCDSMPGLRPGVPPAHQHAPARARPERRGVQAAVRLQPRAAADVPGAPAALHRARGDDRPRLAHPPADRSWSVPSSAAAAARAPSPSRNCSRAARCASGPADSAPARGLDPGARAPGCPTP